MDKLAYSRRWHRDAAMKYRGLIMGRVHKWRMLIRCHGSHSIWASSTILIRTRRIASLKWVVLAIIIKKQLVLDWLHQTRPLRLKPRIADRNATTTTRKTTMRTLKRLAVYSLLTILRPISHPRNHTVQIRRLKLSLQCRTKTRRKLLTRISIRHWCRLETWLIEALKGRPLTRIKVKSATTRVMPIG